METGISAKGENYKSKKGAIKHARKNLESVLLEHGIIDSDDIQGDIPTGRSIHESSFLEVIYNNEIITYIGPDVPTANNQSSPVKDDVSETLEDNSSSDLSMCVYYVCRCVDTLTCIYSKWEFTVNFEFISTMS